MGARRMETWDQLTEAQKADVRYGADLEEGVIHDEGTYERLWEAWMDEIGRDGSWRVDGWPFGE